MQSLPSWPEYGAVALGGAIGSVLRYLTSTFVIRWFGAENAHWGTLSVNLVGCFAIGAIGGALSTGPIWSDRWVLLLRVGVLGGLTTFSAFGWDTFSLLKGEHYVSGFAFVVANVFGIGLVVLGYHGARWVSG